MVIARPLRLQPHAVPKVWGGSALRDVLCAEDVAESAWPESEPVGEVLLVSDQDRHASVISCGPFAGRSLRGLMLSEREALMGAVTLDGDEQFPLVLKLVEARTNLSLQVHPDETAARKLGVQPKSECWYLLDADPGAEVFLGLGDGVDATSFAVGASTPDVVDLLGRYPIRAGDGVDVSPGVVHGMGAGLVLAEVQLNSTTTYRIYDWDRVGLDGRPRETHLDEALRSIDFGAAPQPPGPLKFQGSGGADRPPAQGRALRSGHSGRSRSGRDGIGGTPDGDPRTLWVGSPGRRRSRRRGVSPHTWGHMGAPCRPSQRAHRRRGRGATGPPGPTDHQELTAVRQDS